MLRLSGSLLKRPSLTSAGKSSRRSSCVLMAYGRCLRPALYSSLRSSPSHPMGVSALRVTSAIAHVANNGGFASQLPSRAGFFAMNPATRMRPTELRYWRMGPDPDPRPRNTRYLACDHAQPANQHRQQRARCSFERNKAQQNARLRRVATTPVHRRMAPAWQELFRRLCNFWSGCGHRSGLVEADQCPRARMVVRRSESSHSHALNAHAQARIFRSLVSTDCHYVVVALTNSENLLHSRIFHALISALSCSILLQAITEAAWRKLSPGLMIAHAMRAILLATATVTTRAGRRCNSALIHPASSGLLRQ